MMKRILLLIVGLTGALATSLRAVPFAEIIGKEVQLFASVRSFSDIAARWEGHPVAEILEDEDLQKVFQALFDQEVDEGAESSFLEMLALEFGLTEEELSELFRGQACFALYNAAQLILGESDYPDALFAFEFSGDARRMNEFMKVQFDRNAAQQKTENSAVEHELIEELFMGETLYLDETFDGEKTFIEGGYALVDGVFLFASLDTRLREFVEAMKLGESESIGKTDIYLRSREAAGRGDIGFYLNLIEIIPPLNKAMLAQSMKGGMAMFGVTAQSLDNALSLESMQAIYFDIDIIDEGLLGYGGLIYSDKRGLLSLLSYAEGDLPEATYVPDSVLSSSITLFDFGEMLVEFEEILTVGSPSFPALVDIQMQTMKTHTGVDLRASVLENIGGNVVTVSVMDDRSKGVDAFEQAQQVFILEVKNAEALSKAIETFKDMAPGSEGLIEAQEYEGYVIHTVRGPRAVNGPDAPENDFSYVMTRSNLIVNVGRMDLLHEVLGRMNQADSGFWQKPEITELFERIEQPNPVTRSYLNLGQMIRPFIQAILENGAIDGLDVSAFPVDLGKSFRLISEMNEELDGFFVRQLLIKSELGQ